MAIVMDCDGGWVVGNEVGVRRSMHWETSEGMVEVK